VLNRYLARTGDYGMFSGFSLFQSVRAMVRAHIVAGQGRAAESQAYLDHAFSYLAPRPPIVVAVGGLMGTGKSTLARALAPGLGPASGALVLRSDEIRKRLFGTPPEAKLPAAAYTSAASGNVFAAMLRALAGVTAAGHAVIADATFMDRRLRAAVRHAAGGIRFLGVWLQAPMATLEARVAARRGDASDADLSVLRRAAAHDPGPGDWLAVDGTDAATALAAVRVAIGGG
jgi:predicted kinase